MTRRRAELLAWGLWGLAIATFVGTKIALAFLGDGEISFQNDAIVLPFVLFGTVGAIVASRRPDNRLGWLYLGICLLAALTGIGALFESVTYPEGGPGRLVLLLLYALTNSAWYPTLGLIATFSVLWFPDGRPPTPRWRWVELVIASSIVALSLGFLLAPGPISDGAPSNPIGIPGAESVLGVVQAAGFLSFIFGVLASVTGFVVRFRRSGGVERQQLKWFLVGALVLGVGMVISIIWEPDSDIPFAVVTSAVPIAAGVAITRYHLYDLDRLISR